MERLKANLGGIRVGRASPGQLTFLLPVKLLLLPGKFICLRAFVSQTTDLIITS